MNHHAPQHPMTDAEEREWLAQERALRDERDRAAASDDPLLASYRDVVRALRTPLPHALPANFASRMAAQCTRPLAAARVDTRLEEQVQRVLFGALAATAVAALAVYGKQWLQATADALPVLGSGAAMNWTAALMACLALSWSMESMRRRALGR